MSVAVPIMPLDLIGHAFYTATLQYQGVLQEGVAGGALHWVYCKLSHVAITTPERRAYALRYHISLWDRVDDV